MLDDFLYVGMDESNHGETKSRIGEIVVATFSHDSSFWDYKKNLGRRDFSKIDEALLKEMEYFYTMLPHELAKPNYSNLPLVAPFLVGYYLDLKKEGFRIKMGLDGDLNKDDKNNLTKTFEARQLEVEIHNFTKRNRIHNGPELIYLAHLIANKTISKSLLEIAEDKRYIPFDIL